MSSLVVSVSKDSAYERGKVDFNFFSALVLPDVCTEPWPMMYVAMWYIITTRDSKMVAKILRIALGLPRGFAKTTFLKLVICWLIAYDKTEYLLIVAANEELASNILSDVSDMMGSANMEAVYGSWVSNLTTDNSKEKICVYHGKKLILYALGALSGVRGIAKDNKRPDFILCDDVQTKENDQSEAERKRLKSWLVMTLFKCIAPKGDRVIAYLGNMYSTECILYKLKEMSDWVSLITGAILQDGQSLWPELHSVEDIIDSFFHDEELGLGEDWYAEIMNDPQAASKRLLPADLPSVAKDLLDIEPDAAFITIDPAGMYAHSDDNVVVVHEVRSGYPGISFMGGGNLNPEQLIQLAIEKAIEFRCTVIAVESVAYQSTLCFWLEMYLTAAGLQHYIQVVEVKPHGRHKEARIKEFIEEWLHGRYHFFDEEAMLTFIWYGRKYKIGEPKNKDDYLDAPAYGLDVRRDYAKLLSIMPDDPYAAAGYNRPKMPRVNTPF